MNGMPFEDKPTICVFAAVFVTFAFTGAALSVDLLGALRVFFQPYTAMPVADWAILLYGFWLLGLLWCAYRDWRKGPSQTQLATVPAASMGGLW